MKIRHFAALATALMVLSGCASMGLVQPKSLEDRIVYAAGINAGLRNAAANSLNAHLITSSDGEYVLNVSDQTRTLIDSSRVALSSGDPKTAEGRIVLALNILDQLQAYLNSKVPK